MTIQVEKFHGCLNWTWTTAPERYMYSEAVDNTHKEIDLPTKLRRSDIYRNLDQSQSALYIF